MAQELYELPEGWEWKTLGQLFSIQTGGTPSRSKAEYWNGEIPWYSSGELNNLKTNNPQEFITQLGLRSSNAKVLPAGSLLIGMYDTAAMKMSILDRAAAFNQAIAGIAPKSTSSLIFVKHVLERLKPDILTLRQGVRQKNLNLTKIKDIQIPVPPLAEQKRIVAQLDALFSRIDQTIAQLQHTQAQTKALWASALNAAFETIKTSNLSTLRSIFDVRDGTHDSPKYVSEGYPLITSKNLGADGLHFEKVKLISDEDYDQINKRSKVDKGDMLFAMIGTIGNPTIIEVEPDFAIKNVALFKPSSGKALIPYLRYTFLAPIFKDKMLSEAKGATQKFVGLNYLRDFQIPVPSLPEQEKIVAQLDAIAERTQALETTTSTQLEQLKTLKASLLDAAFRGKF